MEIDSGSHVSTLSKNDALRAKCKIEPSSRSVLGYSGTKIEILGECLVEFSYHDKHFRHNFLVVPSNKVNLLGRDICSKLGLQFCISNEYQSNSINDSVLNNFKDYLSPKFESCVSEEIELEVDPNAKPIFSRSRPIPIKLKDKVCD